MEPTSVPRNRFLGPPDFTRKIFHEILSDTSSEKSKIIDDRSHEPNIVSCIIIQAKNVTVVKYSYHEGFLNIDAYFILQCMVFPSVSKRFSGTCRRRKLPG